MDFPYGETVTVITAGTVVDPYSEETSEDWDAATEADVDGVGVEPRPSDEPLQDARNAVVSGFTLYDPSNTLAEISPRNRIRVRGKVYNVLGEVAEWRSPLTGWTPGTVVQVGLTEG